MDPATTIIKSEALPHQVSDNDIGFFQDTSESAQTTKREEANQKAIYGPVFNIISSILVIVIALGVFKITGLYDGMNSTVGKAVLATVIAYCYLIAFRRGLDRG